jgi:oligopeptide/dipeptide ABC transporter ATP-binding protein
LASRFWKIITTNKKATFGFGLFSIFVLTAIIGPFVAPYDPTALATGLPSQRPSPEHWLGTTRLGQDIFSQLLVGTRSSVAVGLAVGLLTSLLAIAIGVTGGYLGGWADDFLSLITNVFLTIPFVPLMVVVGTYAAAFGVKGLPVIVVMLTLTGWAFGARGKRAQTLSLRSKDFIFQARISGESSARIVLVEILPSMLSLVAATFLFSTVYAVLGEAGLEFIGLGDINATTWGTLLYWAQNSSALLTGAWWWFIPPGICIGLFAASLGLMNYAVDEISNPRLRVPKAPKERRSRRPETAAREFAAPIMTDALLQVDDLVVDYITSTGRVRAVDHVSFTIKPGEIVGLAGESGCGKSTTAHAILRNLQPPAKISGGRILFKGRDLLSLDQEELRKVRWRDISLVFQSAMNTLNPVMRICDQFVDMLQAHEHIGKQQSLARARELLELVGIDPNRVRAFPHELSGGMRQRVVIAQALALNPDLIVMDEPMTALDVVVQRQILQEIQDLQKKLGFAVLFITHDLSLLIEMSDRIAIMYAGEIVEMAGAQTIYRQPEHPYTIGLMNSFPPLPGENRKAINIPGSPPNLANPPSGCRFRTRCAHHTQEDEELFRLQTEVKPELMETEPGHLVACHLVQTAKMRRANHAS